MAFRYQSIEFQSTAVQNQLQKSTSIESCIECEIMKINRFQLSSWIVSIGG